MNKQEIINTLSKGISEIKWTDSHSVEHSAMVTVAPQHLPDKTAFSFDDTFDGRMLTEEQKSGLRFFSAFDVNSENWRVFGVSELIDIEQLTGEGAVNNEKKLQAGTEYMEQLELFVEEDLEDMEHPEL